MDFTDCSRVATPIFREEMNSFLLDLIDDHKRAEDDLRYLHDFVHYKKPDNEFCYFREHAHEDEDSELPFPYLTL